MTSYTAEQVAARLAPLKSARLRGRIGADNENYGCQITIGEARLIIEAVEALTSERDEADRRAGAAERRKMNLEVAEVKRRQWTDDAVRAAGFPLYASFDSVWAEALAALKEKRALAAQQPEVKP